MKITITADPDFEPTTIHPGVSDVDITEAFLGVRFTTEDGAHLAVCMRDDGYEVRYWGDGFESGWVEFKGGSTPPPHTSANPQLNTDRRAAL